MDSTEVRRRWAERTGEYSPEYYAHYGPDGTSETLLDLLDGYVDRESLVLELGCSSGRHLAYLLEHGFERLAGIEVNEGAYDVLAATYPALAAGGTFHLDAIEDVVCDFEDRRFDAVYSVETLQHVHPDEAWVFEEVSRIADDLLVTVENEGDAAGASRPADPDVHYVDGDLPLYYRDWGRVFTDAGLVEVETATDGNDTVRAFRPPDDRPRR